MQDFAEELLELARRAGAAAEVTVAKSWSRPAEFEANRLKQLETVESEGTALRVWRAGRPGVAVAYGAVEPEVLVEKAIALSHLSEPEDPGIQAGEPRRFASVGAAVPVEQLIVWGEGAIAQVRERYPEVICAGAWDCERHWTRLINSRGLDYTYEETTLSGELSAEWVRGEDFLTVTADAVGRERSDLDLAASVLTRLGWAERSATAVAGQIPVVLTAQAADLLWETAAAALSGRRWVEGASPWQTGQQVAVKGLTLTQEPTRGPYSCPFDDEGELTEALTLVQDGAVVRAYCDRASGAALGTGTTGNGFRTGLGSRTTPELVNLWVEPGAQSFEALVRSQREAVVVDQVMGGGGGIAGELSVNLELGYAVRDGEIVGRLKDAMLAGNVYTALRQIGAIAQERQWVGASYTPAVLVEGFSLTV